MGRGTQAARDEAKKNGKPEKAFSSTSQAPASLLARGSSRSPKEPRGPEAIDALKMALQTSRGPKDGRRAGIRRQGRQDPPRLLCRQTSRSRGLLGMLTSYDDDERKPGRRGDRPQSRPHDPGRRLQGKDRAPRGAVASSRNLKDPKQREALEEITGQAIT